MSDDEHWLKMEDAAGKCLADGSGDLPDEFYEAKALTSKFYFDHLLPRTRAHSQAMMADTNSVMALKENQFSFDHGL